MAEARENLFAFVISLLAELTGGGATPAPEPPASPAPLDVRIECDGLSAEEQALIEVQVRSSLHGVADIPGPLLLSCAKDSIVGGWLESGELTSTRSLTVGPRDDRTELLLWLASLLLETRGQVGAPGKEPLAAAQTAGTAGTASAATPAGASSGATETSHAEPSGANDAPQAAAVPPPARAPTPAIPPLLAEPPASSTLSLDLGVRYAHFGSALEGVVGPRLLGEWRVRSGFGVAVAAGMLFGVEQPAELATLEAALLVGAVWTPTRWMRLLVGPSASWVRVSETSGGLQRDSLTAGVEASGQVMWPAGRWAFYSEVGVRGLVDERRVILEPPDGPPLTFVPHWQALFTLGVRYSIGLRTKD